MPFTLLHTADLHLGKSFSELPPERAGQRRADLLATLTRLCRTARERKVDLLCIAGDLFDRPTPALPLVAAVRRALAEAGVPVVLLPGNHDALEEHSPYLDARWPGNVQVATQAGWQRLPVNGQEVWAFGYTLGGAHQNPWAEFPGCGVEAILALHATCLAAGLALEAGYYAFTPAEIPACGYLALGHHHRCAQVQRSPQAWYAGSPEPLTAQADDAAALLVTLAPGATTVEPLPLATRRHRLVTLEVSGRTAGEIWDRALAEAAMDELLTIRLTGMLDAGEPLDLVALRAELSARCFAAEVEARDMHLPPDFSSADGALGTLQAVAQRRLAELPEEDAQRQRLERAVRYAALALEGKL